MNQIANVYNALKKEAGYIGVAGVVTLLAGAGTFGGMVIYDEFNSPQKPAVVERLDEIKDRLGYDVGTLANIALNPQFTDEAQSLLEEETDLKNSQEYRQYKDAVDADHDHPER